MISKLYNMFKKAFAEKDVYAAHRQAIDKYLSQAVDRADLERLERELMKKGWV
jgi:hypothetical protein